MLRISRPFLSRFLAAVVVFLGSGFLIGQMLTDNGSAQVDRAFWEDAKARTLSVSDTETRSQHPVQSVEQILTSSVKPAVKEPLDVAPRKQNDNEEPSVLSLIRENQHVAPAVSSGTDRVSVTVKGGDTLYAIAQRHGLSLSEIAQLNGLKEPYVIKAGQTLYVAR